MTGQETTSWRYSEELKESRIRVLGSSGLPADNPLSKLDNPKQVSSARIKWAVSWCPELKTQMRSVLVPRMFKDEAISQTLPSMLSLELQTASMTRMALPAVPKSPNWPRPLTMRRKSGS